VKVGILAVQGDFEAHGEMLARMGVEHRFVFRPADLEGGSALILPGGESTTQLQFLQEEGLFEGIARFAERGGAILGTCAGTILLAREVHNPSQPSLGLLDIDVARNAYGRQIASEVKWGATKLKPEPLEMVFIRAPIIERVGPGVEVLAESEGHPVLVRCGRVMAATFHPELTDDPTVHAEFVKLTGSSGAAHANRAAASEVVPT
jgi:5'-phosphate synthase pdxT subunit